MVLDRKHATDCVPCSAGKYCQGPGEISDGTDCTKGYVYCIPHISCVLICIYILIIINISGAQRNSNFTSVKLETFSLYIGQVIMTWNPRK